MQFSLRKPFLWILALLFLVGMHYLQTNLGGSGLQLPFNAVSWIFISCLISLSLWQITLNQKIYYSTLGLRLGIVVIALCIPMLYQTNEVAIYAIPRLMGLLAGWLLFIGLMQFGFRKKHLHLILYIILAGIVIEALYGAVQYYLVGVWQVIPEQLLHYYPKTMTPHGILQQSNLMASFMATGLIISLYLSINARWNHHYTWARFIIYSAATSCCTLLILNNSRTGYIAVILGVFLLIPALKNKKNASVKTWLLALFIGMVIGFISPMLAEDNSVTPLYNLSQMSQANGRPLIYQNTLSMISEKPFMGWGYGSFEANFLDHLRQDDSPFKNAVVTLNTDHPHNEILYWAAEGGLIPLMAMLYVAWIIFKLINRAGRINGCSQLALLFPVLFHSMTEYPFYQTTIHWVIFILLLGLIDLHNNKTQSKCWSPTFLIRVIALLITIGTGLFMVTTLKANDHIVKFEVINRYQDPAPLQKIINPIAYSFRFDWLIMSYRFRHGLLMGEQGKVQSAAFADWAEQTVKHTPRVEIYNNWYLSLKHINKPNKAEQVKAEALRLYPYTKKWDKL